MRWHYAGYWKHIWKKFPDKRIKLYKLKTWKKSWNYLNRSISIHISTLDSDFEMRNKTKKIINLINNTL